MRYLKVIAIIYIIAVHLLGFHLYFSKITIPSFYYNFYYKNETSYDFLLIRVIQITDVVFGPTVLPNSSVILPKGKTGHVKIPGEIDSLNTLFIVVAVPCTEKGRLIDIRAKSAFINLIPFSLVRENTFSVDKMSIQKKINTISDNDFIPIEEVLRRFQV